MNFWLFGSVFGGGLVLSDFWLRPTENLATKLIFSLVILLIIGVVWVGLFGGKAEDGQEPKNDWGE